MLKKLPFRIGAGLIAFLLIGSAFYYGYNCWRLYSIYRKNFATSFWSIHRLTGDEQSFMAYVAWARFISDGEPVLLHPENYHPVPCTRSLIESGHSPFGNYAESMRERGKHYWKFIKEQDSVLPEYQCKKGQTNFWVNSLGAKLSDTSLLIYQPQTGQAYFQIN